MAYYEDIIELLDSNGKVKCILCEEYVHDDNNCIDSHINEDQHMELYIKRIMTCNNIVVNKTQPFCVLCKSDIHDLENHIQSSQHQQNMEDIMWIVQKDGSFLNLPTKVKENRSLVYCTICDNNIAFTLKEITGHIESINHRRARAMAVQPLNAIFSIEGTDDLWCKICQLCFENYIEIIFEHVDEDKKHITTLSKIHRLIAGQNITIEKYLTDPGEDKAQCHKCDINVPCNQDNIERHVKGKRHKNA